MKGGAGAILIFVAAFVLTTAGLIFLNTQFMNIFKFDFRSVGHSSLAVSDSTLTENSTAENNTVKDSVIVADSLKNAVNQNEQKSDTTKIETPKESKLAGAPVETKPQPENKTVQNNAPVQQNNAAEKPVVSENTPPDTKKMDPAAYDKWKKNMAGILEIMDSKKASQILKTYSDNIARDLFYTMKKKKAADILSKFDQKTDSLIIRKLTRMQ